MTKATLKEIPVTKDQLIGLNIDLMAYDNSAIGRYKDLVVMVNRAAPGDELTAQITTLRPNYARANIIEIIKSDPNYRIEAPCKVYKVCGGCQWQHIPYEKQLEQKNLLMQNFISRLKLQDNVLEKIIRAETIWNYRNKVQYPVRTVSDTHRLKAGYFGWHSNDLVNIKHCPIQQNLFDDIVDTVRELAPKYKITAYNRKHNEGWLRHICVRANQGTNGTKEVLLTLVSTGEKLYKSQEFAKEVMDRHKELVGICINVNTKTTNVIYGEKTIVIKGRGYIFEEIKGLKFKISATSFFQVNTQQTEKLLDIVGEMICRDAPAGCLYNIILDAYCGVGLFSLPLAKRAKKIVGIEEIKQSIDDAIYSARENNIKNVVFINGKVENKIREIIEKEKPEIIVLDPPRIGCSKKVLEDISCLHPQKIIYISCNPATLVRDLEILSSKNYKIRCVQPIDMFPHSYHIENVALIESVATK